MTSSLERVRPADAEDGALAAVRNPGFPAALRGYDRDAVDAYVARVTRVVDQLEATRSPDAAIRRALDEVGEETSGILQQARETASEITARSRAQADDRIREAEREARELVADAEARVRELDADFARIWDERDRLLDEVRALAERLLAVADDAEEQWDASGAEGAHGDTASLPALAEADDAEPGEDYADEVGEPGRSGDAAGGDPSLQEDADPGPLGPPDASPFAPPPAVGDDAAETEAGERHGSDEATSQAPPANDDQAPGAGGAAAEIDFDFGEVIAREGDRSEDESPEAEAAPGVRDGEQDAGDEHARHGSGWA